MVVLGGVDVTKKKTKIKFTNLFLLIVLFYILVQVVIWTIGYFTKTMVLEEEDIDLQMRKKGIIVMDETIVEANEDGTIKYNVADNEKIKKDKLLFTISQSRQNEEVIERIENLKNEINDLERSKNIMNSNIILNKNEEDFSFEDFDIAELSEIISKFDENIWSDLSLVQH